jgi:nicotinate-nucleotide pyrophosphorylase (carboxylating)
LQGNARAVLSGERTALNFLAHLSGIATLTYEFTRRIRPYRVKLLDTRKTTPNLRHLEKYAVKMGGGYTHREGLWKGILIKDNHLKVYRQKYLRSKSAWDAVGHLVSIAKARRLKDMPVEVEVGNLKEFKAALASRPDIIMLDNMDYRRIRQAVRLRNKLNNRVLLEVSGGVNLANVRRIAASGVDWISIGMLTQSAPSLDVSLEITKVF